MAKPAVVAAKPAAKKTPAKKAAPTKVFIDAIVEAVKEKHLDMTKKTVHDILSESVDAILDCLTSGVAVNINNLGTFNPIVRPARKGAKLPNGNIVDLPPKKSVRFAPSTKIYASA